MISLKQIVIESIVEQNKNVLTEDNIDCISDVSFNKDKDYVKIQFNTTFGKKGTLVARYSQFKKWASKFDKSKGDMFSDFLKAFISCSSETSKDDDNIGIIDEIIDDNNNIIDDNGLPNNSTNSKVGSSKWDMEKAYSTLIPKTMRMYSGNLGVGAIVW